MKAISRPKISLMTLSKIPGFISVHLPDDFKPPACRSVRLTCSRSRGSARTCDLPRGHAAQPSPEMSRRQAPFGRPSMTPMRSVGSWNIWASGWPTADRNPRPIPLLVPLASMIASRSFLPSKMTSASFPLPSGRTEETQVAWPFVFRDSFVRIQAILALPALPPGSGPP